MPEPDFEMDVVRGLRDIGVTPPDSVQLHHRVASAVAREIEGGGRRWRALAGRALVPSIAVVVAVAVIAVALSGPKSQAPDRPSTAPAAGLVARLAVLRRPQAPDDRLPSPLHLRAPSGNGPIVPSLTRLVATPPGVRLYLVVTRPSAPRSGTGRSALWSPQLGDQVAIVAVTKAGATETLGRPAADLSDGLELEDVGYVGPDRRAGGSTYAVTVVPDGVARATWTYRVLRIVDEFTVPTRRTIRVHPQIAHNVAYRAASVRPRQLLAAQWYAADGRRLPTSTRALVRAARQRQERLRAQALAAAEHNTDHADPRLLAGFAVFGVTSRAGIRLANGVRIANPPLSSLPEGILSELGPGDTVAEPDPHAVRQVTMPSGIRFWVIAGRRGLCVAEIDRPTPPVGNPALAGLNGGGSGEGCTSSITSALARGSGVSSSDAGGSVIYMVAPKAHPSIRIQTGPHSHRTVRPPFGVYATRTRFRIG